MMAWALCQKRKVREGGGVLLQQSMRLTSACKPTAFGAGMRARWASISWFAGVEVWRIPAAAEAQAVGRHLSTVFIPKLRSDRHRVPFNTSIHLGADAILGAN